MGRRLKGEGSVYQRGDGRWVASVSLGRKPDGRRARRVVYGATAEEALAAKAELLADVAAGLSGRARPGTLDAYLQTWVDVTLPQRVAAGELTQDTRDQYAEKVRLYVTGTALGRMKLRDIEPPDVRTWLAWLSTRKTRRGVRHTPGGVRLVYRVLRAALQDAVDDGLLLKSPAVSVKPPKAVRYAARPLTADQARTILARPGRHQALWTTFLYLGLRHGEALALRWSDLDFQGRQVTIRGTKTESSSVVLPLPDPVARALEDHRLKQRKARLRARVWVDPDLVFPSTVGTPLNPSNVRWAWRHTCEAAGVDPRRIHDLRHTTATLLYEAGVPVPTIAAILRHASPAVTAAVYTHIFADTKQAAQTKLGDLLAGD